MTYTNNRAGLQSVGEYQISGWPWVTSSVAPITTPTKVTFPYIAADIYLQNNGTTPIKFGFTQNGTAGTNCYSIPASGSMKFHIKTPHLYVLGVTSPVSYSLLVGLTSVLTNEYPYLSSSAPTGSIYTTYGYPSDPAYGTGLG